VYVIFEGAVEALAIVSSFLYLYRAENKGTVYVGFEEPAAVMPIRINSPII